MLTPEQLSELTSNSTVISLCRQAEEDILQDMARRMSKSDFGSTSTAQWQAYRLEQSRLFRSAVVRRLAKLSGESQPEIRKMLQQAGTYTLLNDDAAYRKAGKATPPLNGAPTLLNLLNAGAAQTGGTFQNITATTANTATRQFENALDRAWMQVSTGAFDCKTAIRRAVTNLANQGLQSILYTKTGHVDTLEVATRRALLTGVNQTCAKLQIERMNQMGCEFVEVTAHVGARPTHAEWQGRVYHRGGSITYQGKHYEDFVSATGYGSGDGLCGWNCRHNFYPFYPGISERVYSEARLQELNARNVTYQGKRYTRYEINQMQRARERQVRKYKRQYLCEEAAGLDSTKSAVKLKAAREQLQEFAYSTGGRVDSARTGVNGFGRSAASSATALAYRTSADSSKIAIYSKTQYREMLKHAVQYSVGEKNASLPFTGKANSVAELVQEDGTIKQRRVYGANGKPMIDYDMTDHGQPKYHPTGAHKHEFNYRLKNPHGKALPLTDFDLEYNQDVIQEG